MADEVPTASEWIAQSEYLTSRGGYQVAYRRRGSGPKVLLLHGFPTWSYDYAAVATDLAGDHEVTTVDFLGYGASDKPNPHAYSVDESADIVEDLAGRLGLDDIHLVVHDYGGIVGQELLDRHRNATLTLGINRVTILNSGIVYAMYRPTLTQRLLPLPVLGAAIANNISPGRFRAALDAVRGDAKLSDAEFDNLWRGVARDDGQKLAHLLIGYNAERKRHHTRWEAALAAWAGPLGLVWGLDDPVSGRHVLERATEALPRARVTALAGVGHFPQSEAPVAVAAALRGPG
jgi:pimeloyl-ACP methyl ester carboxylesterase